MCGYGQSRSIPYYITFSPKVKDQKGGVSKVCNYLPRYETLMSRDSTEMQVEKLVLADLLHGHQLTANSNHLSGIHPWSLDLIKT